ncbi:MAG: T9SS type A sorting domain-containing protein [Flavobacteriales bacterium]
MKTPLLLAGFILTASVILAQSPVPRIPTNRTSAQFHPATETTLSGPQKITNSKPTLSPSAAKVTAIEEFVGVSNYDLQTNNSIQNRIIADANGVSAAFTYSLNPSGGTYPDRGTGYNRRVDGEWGPDPTSRIEDVRTGWPSLIHLGDGSEVVINHSGTGGVRMWKRAQVGSGSWTGSVIPTQTGLNLIWPRAVAGGADGNTIHMVCVTEPDTETAGELYLGMNTALLYFRSLDGGITWDVQDFLLPDVSSSNFNGFSADIYAIHARGNKVAIGVFGEFFDSMVFTSEDNGDNWTRTVIWDFPIDLYTIDDGTDIESDGIQDTILTTDGAGAIFIDEDMHVHASMGILFMTDDLGVVDEVYTYFPLVGDILYWNDTFVSQDDVISIATAPDYDEFGGPDGVASVGQYGNVGVCSHPQFAQGEDGTLYVTFMAVNDLFFNGTEYYRHVFAIKSEDGGITWTEPSDITPDFDEDGFEYTYPSMAPVAHNDKIHLIVQRDTEPGIHVQPEDAADPVTENDMIYVCVTSDLVNVQEISMHEAPTLTVYPNPATDQISIRTSLGKHAMITITDIAGKEVLREMITLQGNHTIELDSLQSGLYHLQVTKDGTTLTQRVILE